MYHCLQLMLSYHDCGAVAAFAGRAISAIAAHIDERVDDWWETNWFKTSDAVLMGPTKKRRVDQHVRDWCVSEALSSKEQNNASSALRSIGKFGKNQAYVLRDDMLSAMRCQAHMDFAQSQVVSLAWDGARFGNPGREFVLASLSDLAENKHCVLPPQDSAPPWFGLNVYQCVALAPLQETYWFRKAFYKLSKRAHSGDTHYTLSAISVDPEPYIQQYGRSQNLTKALAMQCCWLENRSSHPEEDFLSTGQPSHM